MPSFVLGLVLVLLFAVQLRWLPSGGQEGWRSAILPVVTLSFAPAATLTRFIRSAVLEALGSDYVTTARAKGVREALVVGRHALRNSLITAALHSRFDTKHIARVLGAQLTRYLLSMQYGLAATLLKAVEDYLAGPDMLHDGGADAVGSIRTQSAS